MSERHERGRLAEQVVATHLEREGFDVLARNVRLGHLELDIVARKGPLAVIVEVRTRGPGAYAGALASITWSKRRFLLRATERLWRTRLSKMREIERVRIDVAVVDFSQGTRVEYFPGAIVG